MDASLVGKSRKAEEKGSGLIKINPIALKGAGAPAGQAGGFKKGGFKSAFGKMEGEGGMLKSEITTDGVVEVKSLGVQKVEGGESDTEDEGYEVYDPERPTGCAADCKGRH